MALLLDDIFLPATLACPPMTDEQFADFCAEHPDLEFEMTAEGELIAMAPTNFFTGNRNFDLVGQLRAWAKRDGRGLGGDSSTGFVLPNGARRSPDASWTLKSRIAEIDPSQRKSFLHLCPDFVIELRSETDRLRRLREKLQEYLDNGAQLGWLIDPTAQTIEIYRPNQPVEILTHLNEITADGPVEGFTLDLADIWNPPGL